MGKFWAYFASLAFPPERVVRQVLAALSDAGRPMSVAGLEPLVELSRSRLEMVLKVLDVDGAVRRVRGGWAATGQPWEYDAQRYQGIAHARTAEQQAILAYQDTTGCRMEFLLRQLDDPHAAPCGRCDNCTGRRWGTDVSETGLAAAAERLRKPGIELPPRRIWPSNMDRLGVPLSGKLTTAAEPGRALGRLTDIGWGNRLRALFASPADDPVPDDLFQACVTVLAGWEWARRPVGVVAIGSTRRPTLVSSLADRIATVGRLPPLGQIGTAPADGRRANSAQRLAQVWHSLRVSPDLATAMSTVDGPVLLVDDQVDTGWTMTLAAHLLREAGAPAVLPFALATTT